MKLALVAPGIMSIPPIGWGAVEMMLWDYYNVLKNNSIEVILINVPDRNKIIEVINEGNFDIVHIHYDAFSDILPLLKVKVKIISSHYPFLNNKEKYLQDNFHSIFNKIVKNKDTYIFASSPKDINTFLEAGVSKERLFHSRLGIDSSSYYFSDTPEFDKTICFSQIVNRKRQFLIQNIEGIDFYGRMDDGSFINKKNYFGEINRDDLNKTITKYANFILLSSIENTTPLVVKEALICGLGVVVSKSVGIELNEDKDFITILDESIICNEQLLIEAIIENKNSSITKRKEIREYGIKKFDIGQILKNEYITKLNELLNYELGKVK